jgi:hypothetical protein
MSSSAWSFREGGHVKRRRAKNPILTKAIKPAPDPAESRKQTSVSPMSWFPWFQTHPFTLAQSSMLLLGRRLFVSLKSSFRN